MFAKKSLGQNFLKSKAALRAMVEAAQIDSKNQTKPTILEVGPGKGALTKALLEEGAYVLALEKDDRLIPILLESFKKEINDGHLQILHTDALTFDPSEIENKKGSSIYSIVANIPYYITGIFFKHYLTHKAKPQRMMVMVQKEVADRIVTRDGKESLLSLSIKCYGTPRYVMTVQKKYFSPEPKVNSAIIAVDNISNKFFIETQDTTGISGVAGNFTEEKFFTLIKAGFAHKRKVLISNLLDLMPSGAREISREKLEKVFAKLNIPLKARAEDIALQSWKEIAREIF